MALAARKGRRPSGAAALALDAIGDKALPLVAAKRGFAEPARRSEYTPLLVNSGQTRKNVCPTK